MENIKVPQGSINGYPKNSSDMVYLLLGKDFDINLIDGFKPLTKDKSPILLFGEGSEAILGKGVDPNILQSLISKVLELKEANHERDTKNLLSDDQLKPEMDEILKKETLINLIHYFDTLFTGLKVAEKVVMDSTENGKLDEVKLIDNTINAVNNPQAVVKSEPVEEKKKGFFRKAFRFMLPKEKILDETPVVFSLITHFEARARVADLIRKVDNIGYWPRMKEWSGTALDKKGWGVFNVSGKKYKVLDILKRLKSKNTYIISQDPDLTFDFNPGTYPIYNSDNIQERIELKKIEEDAKKVVEKK